MFMRRLSVACVFLLSCCSIFSAPLFSVTKDADSVAFPKEIYTNAQAIGDFTITNNSATDQPTYFSPVPKGFSYVDISSSVAGACSLNGGAKLGPKGTCKVRLAYISARPTTVTEKTPMVCNSVAGTACASVKDPIQFAVKQQLTTPATLTTLMSAVNFVAGKTTQIAITNSSTTTAANNVQLTMPGQMRAYLLPSSVTSCQTIAPQATCTLKLAMAAGLANTDPTRDVITVTSSDANTVTLYPRVTSTLVNTTSSIEITQPGATGNQSIIVNNVGDIALSQPQISITLPSGVSQVANTCTGTLAAHSYCKFTYQANDAAYGSATGAVTYTPQGGSQATINVTIAVAPTTLVINPNTSNTGQDIVAATSGTIEIKNTGAFTAQSLTIGKGAADSWFTLTSASQNPCGSVLSASSGSNTCNIAYTQSVKSAESGHVTAGAANAAIASQGIISNGIMAIGVDTDPNNEHLYYRSVLVKNFTGTEATIDTVDADPTSALQGTAFEGNVVLCDKTGTTDANCDASYLSTCYVGAKIANQSSCRLWYRAKIDNKAFVPTTTGIVKPTIHITATADKAYDLKQKVSFTYSNTLYVTYFNVDEMHAAVQSWDGSAWVQKNSLTADYLHNLVLFDGDLYYAKEDFINDSSLDSSSYLVKWNGAQSTTQLSPDDDDIRMLLPVDQQLYIGGTFSQLGGVDANNIAQWSPVTNTVTALGDGADNTVTTLVLHNNMLYVGGVFTEAGGQAANSVATWNVNSQQWSPIGQGLSNTLSASSKDMLILNNNLYVAGSFSGAGGLDVNNIASWNIGTEQWSPLGNGIPSFSTYTSGLYRLATADNKIFAGGYFTQAGTLNIENIAQWDPSTSTWSALGDGINDELEAIATFNNKLYVSGDFTQAGGQNVNYIAQWDPSTSTWSALGSGLPSDGGPNILVVPTLSITAE